MPRIRDLVINGCEYREYAVHVCSLDPHRQYGVCLDDPWVGGIKRVYGWARDGATRYEPRPTEPARGISRRRLALGLIWQGLRVLVGRS